MATIKSFTDLEQSKKLAEILPIESADMWWSRCTIIDFDDGALKVSYAVEPCNISQFRNTKEDIPCWSLVALFNVMPQINGGITPHGHKMISFPNLSQKYARYGNIVLYQVIR